MQAITYHPVSRSWHLTDLPMPKIQHEYEVLIRVHACGLNPVDAKIAQWQHLVPEMNPHWVCGLDVSGEIIAIGKAVTNWKIGDRILTHGNMFHPCGGFAQFSVQNAHTLIPHPHVDATIAAATPCAGWTAWRALHDRLRLTSQHSLLIAGGSGGVGSFATQIARLAGVSRLFVTTSAANADFVRSLGASDTIDYSQQDIVATVLALTQGLGVDRGLDCVGGSNVEAVADSLGFEGEMVELVDVVNPTKYNNAFMKGLGFHQLSLGSGHRHGNVGYQSLIRSGTAFSVALENGEITVPRLEVVALKDVPEALQAMQARRTVGKIVMHLGIE